VLLYDYGSIVSAFHDNSDKLTELCALLGQTPPNQCLHLGDGADQLFPQMQDEVLLLRELRYLHLPVYALKQERGLPHVSLVSIIDQCEQVILLRETLENFLNVSGRLVENHPTLVLTLSLDLNELI
jgi:hypothetical protein